MGRHRQTREVRAYCQHPDGDTQAMKYAITLGPDYDEANWKATKTQLVKAGFRLAKLLEVIFN